MFPANFDEASVMFAQLAITNPTGDFNSAIWSWKGDFSGGMTM